MSTATAGHTPRAYYVDLHTHSAASPDGGITPAQYKQMLDTGVFHTIAITDHDRIDLAQQLHQQLGDRIIVGQEITTTDGEIIGLFLTQPVAPHQSAQQTAEAVRAQGGLVYIPHPFETVRKGLSLTSLDAIAPLVDIIETHNGRAVFQNRGPRANVWANRRHTARAASSDAHGLRGMGRTYTTVTAPLTRENCLDMLTSATFTTGYPPLTTLLYPKINRLKKRARLHRHD